MTDPGGAQSGRSGANPSAESQVSRHDKLGWWALLVFLSLGILLESLHGLKVGFYLDVTNETRRHMWTLAHTHGTLLALINLVFASATRRFGSWKPRSRALASTSLVIATLLLPSGFFLGGLFFHQGDPGLGILLVPCGALFLLLAVLLTARAVE